MRLPHRTHCLLVHTCKEPAATCFINMMCSIIARAVSHCQTHHYSLTDSDSIKCRIFECEALAFLGFGNYRWLGQVFMRTQLRHTCTTHLFHSISVPSPLFLRPPPGVLPLLFLLGQLRGQLRIDLTSQLSLAGRDLGYVDVCVVMFRHTETKRAAPQQAG